MRQLPLLGLVALVAALPGCGGGAGSSALATQPHPLVANDAPAPTSRKEMTLDGTLVQLPAPGKVTLIDFWATSCRPCVAMMPKLAALHEEKRAAGLVVVGVAADDNPGLVQQRLRELGVKYPNVVDDSGTVRGAYRVTDLPQSVLVDRHGKVRVVRLGGGEEDLRALRAAVDTLLGEP